MATGSVSESGVRGGWVWLPVCGVCALGCVGGLKASLELGHYPHPSRGSGRGAGGGGG